MLPTNAQIIDFLGSRTADAGFVDKLKIRYRPVVCPFQDLLSVADVESVFDIGCGSGQFCALLAKYTGVRRIMGIEINETLVRNADEVTADLRDGRTLRFAVFNGVDIPDEIGDYDLVYMIDVYHHIPKGAGAAFMEQVFRKMKPGARLMFKDIDKGSPLVLFNKLHDLVFAGEVGHEMSARVARQLLEKIGFSVVKDYRKTVAVYPHYFLLCEKRS